MALWEVVDLVPDPGHRDQRAGAEAPELRVHAVLRSASASACERGESEHTGPAKPTSKPVPRTQAHGDARHTKRARLTSRRGSGIPLADSSSSSTPSRRLGRGRRRSHPEHQIITSAAPPRARSPSSPANPRPNRANSRPDRAPRPEFASDFAAAGVVRLSPSLSLPPAPLASPPPKFFTAGLG
jgi:hypothetical protein